MWNGTINCTTILFSWQIWTQPSPVVLQLAGYAFYRNSCPLQTLNKIIRRSVYGFIAGSAGPIVCFGQLIRYHEAGHNQQMGLADLTDIARLILYTLINIAPEPGNMLLLSFLASNWVLASVYIN